VTVAVAGDVVRLFEAEFEDEDIVADEVSLPQAVSSIKRKQPTSTTIYKFRRKRDDAMNKIPSLHILGHE
jgi:hypothetical protein